MKCTNCGTELAEGVKFCGSCGTPVPVAEPINEVPVAPVTEEAPVVTQEAKTTEAQPAFVSTVKTFLQKNKMLITCGVCLAILIATIALVASVFSGGNGFIAMEHSISVSTDDGEIVIIYDNKKVVKTGIDADGVSGSQTSIDGKVVVVRTNEHDLVVVRGKKAKVVAHDVVDFKLSVSGKGIAFVTENEDGEYTLMLNKVGSKKSKTIQKDYLGDDYYDISPDGKAVAYYKFNDDGDASLMLFTGSKSKKIASEVELVGLSNGGKLIYVVGENKDGDDVLYAYTKSGNKKKIGTIDDDDIYFNADHTQVMFYNEGKTYISNKGKEAKKALSSEADMLIPDSSSCMEGDFAYTYPTDDLYKKVYSGDNGSLYLIKKNADKNVKLASKAYNYTLDESAKFVYYMNSDAELMMVQISKGERASDKAKQIAEDVVTYVVSPDRSHVYYVADGEVNSCNGKTGKGHKLVGDIDSGYYGYSLYVNKKGVCFYQYEGDVYASVNGRKGKMVLSEGSLAYATENGIVYAATEDGLFANATGKKFKKIYSAD